MEKNILLIRKRIAPLLKKNNVVKAGIFGSYARGEQTTKSDVDILVQFKGKMGLIKFIELEEKLEKKLRKKVDLVTYNSLSPLLREKILGEEIAIL